MSNNNFDKTIQPFAKFYKAKRRFLIKHSQYLSKRIGQIGGTYPEKVKIKVEDKTYKFVYQKDNNLHFYMLYDSKDNERCVMILIDEQENNALIDNINGDYQYCPNGSKLLDATIKFLKEYASELNIKRIVLTDNSMKKCYGESIKFADMYSLIYGITWYSSKGFLPYDQIKKDVDDAIILILHHNKTIIEKTYVRYIKNLKKILVKHGKLSKVDAQIIIDKYKDKKLYRFFENMLKDYEDKDLCMLFYNVYQYVMIDLGIQSMYGKTFFMEL